ncbi:MAG: HupE/UreJ family protein [Planktothrix sp.]|uniref:HupE/UreJ family protein n=1 Tax=Planktothrix sp. TaxID=3088171 RepID=UPI0038D50BB2
MFKSFQNLGQNFALQSRNQLFLLGVSLLLLLMAQPATAHHAFDGQTPETFFQGFLSGLAHPMIGIDHFAFILSIGLIAASLVSGIWMIIAFLLAAMLGTGIHVISWNLPLPEIAIALSVITIGILLVLKKQLPLTVLIGLASIAGLFHGYAYGESIIGAKMMPLISYLAGFTVMQFIIAGGTMKLAQSFQNTLEARQFSLIKYSGFAVVAIGVIALSSAITG